MAGRIAYTKERQAQLAALVVIEYGTVRDPAVGWMPAIWINGKRQIVDSRGFDKDTAIAMALRDAKEEASRYRGDWDVRTLMKDTSRGRR
jgi:hypothetical protein